MRPQSTCDLPDGPGEVAETWPPLQGAADGELGVGTPAHKQLPTPPSQPSLRRRGHRNSGEGHPVVLWSVSNKIHSISRICELAIKHVSAGTF